MRMYSQTFAGAGVWPLGVQGQLFRLINTDDGEPVDVTFYRGGSIVASAVGMESGFYAKPAGGFDRVDITSATAQTVKVLVMDGDGGYDRFIVDIASSIGEIGVTLSGDAFVTIKQGATIADTAAVAVGVAATALLAASATRKSARFYNAGTADVYLGGAAVTTANGCIKIEAGQTYIENDAAGAAWYGISGTAGQSVRIQGVE